jgi:serine protease Do
MKRCSLVLSCLMLGGLVGLYAGRLPLRGQVAAPPPPKELTSYRDVVKKVLPAVVSIESRSRARGRPARRGGPVDEQQQPEEFRRFFEDMQRLPEGDGPGRVGFGSGFLVDPKGAILTNFHVVDGADEVEVQLRDGRKFVSKDIKGDSKTDLALVHIAARGALPFLELGDSDGMEIGDRVLAVGAPFGLTGSVTAGIVSAKGRALRMNMYEDFLQTDAAINPGNSGGPLVNLEGQVIGINAAIKSRNGGFQGVGMAISSNLARNIMKQLAKDGAVHRGYLGVHIQDLDNADLAARLGLKDTQGVLVTRALDAGPGSKAGLRGGDIIVTLAGKAVKDGRELQTAVAGLPLGKPVDLTVVRDGRPRALKVTIEEQPENIGTTRAPFRRTPRVAPEEVVAVEAAGVDVTDLTADLAEGLGYKENARGALVVRVERNGPASAGGVRGGMLITQLDKQPVTSAKDLRDKAAKGSLEKGVLIRYETPEGETYYALLKGGQ